MNLFYLTQTASKGIKLFPILCLLTNLNRENDFHNGLSLRIIVLVIDLIGVVFQAQFNPNRINFRSTVRFENTVTAISSS